LIKIWIGSNVALRDSSHAHHVVIVGAGFGGLEVAHHLSGARVCITIIDQRNHHLFQPLLYQVATASLATSEIAWPIRHLLRRRHEVTTLLGVVRGIDCVAGKVLLEDGGAIAYDTLVLELVGDAADDIASIRGLTLAMIGMVVRAQIREAASLVSTFQQTGRRRTRDLQIALSSAFRNARMTDCSNQGCFCIQI
jgi:NADH dehydrogenase FAD-containing subunit